MTNADKFKSLFGLYATELWAMPEKDFLEWLNSEVSNCSEFPNGWTPCTPETMPKKDGEYLVTYEKGYAEDYGFDLVSIAPFEVDCEGFGIWQEKFDLHTLGSLGSDWVDIPVIAWRELPAPYQPKEDES